MTLAIHIQEYKSDPKLSLCIVPDDADENLLLAVCDRDNHTVKLMQYFAIAPELRIRTVIKAMVEGIAEKLAITGWDCLYWVPYWRWHDWLDYAATLGCTVSILDKPTAIAANIELAKLLRLQADAMKLQDTRIICGEVTWHKDEGTWLEDRQREIAENRKRQCQ